MRSPSLFSRWLRAAALAFVAMSVTIGAATPSPADAVAVCARGECSEAVETPDGSTNTACGPGSPGAAARRTIYRVVGDEFVWICDQEAGVAVGVAPGYVIGTSDVFIVVFSG